MTETQSLCIGFVLTMALMIAFVTRTPHQISDWFWRKQFVQSCVLGANGRLDDEILRKCNAAYWARVDAETRGWLPSEP